MLSSAEFKCSQLGMALGCKSESSLLPVSLILRPRLKALWGHAPLMMEELQETRPPSTSSTEGSAHIISASTPMAMPNTGREGHLSHGVEKGVGESGLNDNNQLDLPPCITELPNNS